MFYHAIKYNKHQEKVKKKKTYSKGYSDHVALYIFPPLLIY